MLTKVCRVCGEDKPLDFYTNDIRNKDGKKGTCKLCYNEIYRERQKIARAKTRETTPTKHRASEMRQKIRQRCRRRGWKFDEKITTEWLEKKLLENNHCPCCKTPFSREFNGDKTRSPSVDRIDSSKPYRFQDLEIICNRCNTIKNNASLKELEQIAHWMRSELIKRGYSFT